MNPVEVIPLLVVALLLLSAGGAEPEQVTLVLEGDHEVDAVEDALLVGGGTVRVPADVTTSGTVFVIGGDVEIAGRLAGDVTVLAGNLSLAETATVTGELQTIAGRADVAEGASVGRQTSLATTAPRRSGPFSGLAWLAAQVAVLAAATAWLSRRHPLLLRNVADSITEHSLVSGVVGSVAGAALLVLFVYMAFTIVLLPLSVLGVVAEGLTVLYGYAAYGYLLGRRLPIARVDLASAVGAGVFIVGVELLGSVPLLGAVAQFALVVTGLGAVLITYFGFREFEPATIPE